ncbi:SDR family NAD(P)-dependent oxidoreductase [Staphylococcus simulans]|uniref:SDR family oxidoreductase n=1 Tax=Staphylococcus simulans TaxID=1286 RepID=UPI000E680174|nr:SDR family oxidoreductase [Staphylococcus simulans]RIN43794.1 SDR family NAD(P)-dependent oxidoreductase [Staphylococcus simulans]UXR45581.1 SDR family oxidoreductase [Staphylococcus simulans]
MIPYEIDLNNKTVVVTGGNGVIGSAMSKSLAQVGANIAIIGLNDETGAQVVREIEEAGGKALFISASVTDKAQMEQAKTKIHEAFGKVDVLINGAGGNHPKGTTDDEHFDKDNKDQMQTFFELDEASVGFVFDLNFLGTFIPSQVFAQDMIDNKEATIINISSMNAFTPLTKIPAYSGAKAAVSNFTQWLSVYLADTGVRVNAIAPGFLVTSQNEKLLIKEDGSYSSRAEKILNATPLHRFGKPEELIGALFFLVDYRSSSFVDGVVLPVDGGFNAYSGV